MKQCSNYYDYYNSIINYMTIEDNVKYSNKIIDAYKETKEENNNK